MGTSFSFNNKVITEPGAYSTIKPGAQNVPPVNAYGKVLIIDTGLGAGFGAGSGSFGTLKSGLTALTTYDDLKSFRDAVGGGPYWAIAKWLYQPYGFALPGISQLLFLKAATTAPAEATFDPVGGGANGGTIVLQCNNEGLAGNGDENYYNVLTKGYAFKMKAGISADTYQIDFLRGTFKGLDTLNVEPWDDILEDDTVPEVLVTSDEFATIAELHDWMINSSAFKKWFTVKSFTEAGTGDIDDADLTTFSVNNLFAGGTETYEKLDETLDYLSELDYTFVLASEFGADAQGANNSSILTHLKEEAKFARMMFVGGGYDSTLFAKGVTNSSIDTAEFYDTDYVVVVHGGFKKLKQNGSYKLYDQMFKTAAVLGRIAGLQPQIPGTFKGIDIDAEVHIMSEHERTLSIKYGVLATKWDNELNHFAVVQAVTSLQLNSNLVNLDGSTPEISIVRIANELNRELIYDAKINLLGKEDGVNRATLSALDVKKFTEAKLASKCATTTQDNLLISYQNVTVTADQDSYWVTYGFIPNYPINKLFFTGFMLEPTYQ